MSEEGERRLKGRRWLWTINDYDWSDTGEHLFVALPPNVRFIIWSHEKAAHDHLQGYVRFSNPTTFGQCVRLLSVGGCHPHVKMADGTEQQNIDYCSKLDETHVCGPWQFGVPLQDKGQGARTDLVQLAEKVRTGTFTPTTDDCDGAHLIKYARGISMLETACRMAHPRMRDSVAVECIVGPSGIGKSTLFWDWHIAQNKFEEVYKVVYPKPGQAFFWPGYVAQTVLLLDEWDPSCLKPQDFNQMCDPFPHKVRVSVDQFAWANWTTMIILSNTDPSVWYLGEWQQSVRDAVIRRVTVTGTTLTVNSRLELAEKCWPPGLIHPRWNPAP